MTAWHPFPLPARPARGALRPIPGPPRSPSASSMPTALRIGLSSWTVLAARTKMGHNPGQPGSTAP